MQSWFWCPSERLPTVLDAGNAHEAEILRNDPCDFGGSHPYCGTVGFQAAGQMRGVDAVAVETKDQKEKHS